MHSGVELDPEQHSNTRAQQARKQGRRLNSAQAVQAPPTRADNALRSPAWQTPAGHNWAQPAVAARRHTARCHTGTRDHCNQLRAGRDLPHTPGTAKQQSAALAGPTNTNAAYKYGTLRSTLHDWLGYQDAPPSTLPTTAGSLTQAQAQDTCRAHSPKVGGHPKRRPHAHEECGSTCGTTHPSSAVGPCLKANSLWALGVHWAHTAASVLLTGTQRCSSWAPVHLSNQHTHTHTRQASRRDTLQTSAGPHGRGLQGISKACGHKLEAAEPGRPPSTPLVTAGRQASWHVQRLGRF